MGTPIQSGVVTVGNNEITPLWPLFSAKLEGERESDN